MDEFEADQGIALQALRHEGCVLADRRRMQAYCLDHLDSAMDRESREYGFRMDTDKFTYLLRLNPREGEVRIYCYIQQWLDSHIEKAKKGIRFITSGYDDLFRLRDGGKIRIECGDGRTLEQVCRYIDEYHLEVGAYPHEESICKMSRKNFRNYLDGFLKNIENGFPAYSKSKLFDNTAQGRWIFLQTAGMVCS